MYGTFISLPGHNAIHTDHISWQNPCSYSRFRSVVDPGWFWFVGWVLLEKGVEGVENCSGVEGGDEALFQTALEDIHNGDFHFFHILFSSSCACVVDSRLGRIVAIRLPITPPSPLLIISSHSKVPNCPTI